MNDRLNLEIGGSSCYLSDDASISIEMNSPLFNDSGTFSYPVTIPYSANAFLFRSSAEIDNDESISRLREDFILYVDGDPLLVGVVRCTDISPSDDSADIELTSSNTDFWDLLSDKSLRDLDFGTRLPMGNFKKLFHLAYGVPYYDAHGVFYDQYYNLLWGTIFNINYNTESYYPKSAYCHIPVMLTGTEKSEDWSKDLATKLTFLSARRRCSSPCFFILFVLKEIFKLMDGFSYSDSDNELYAIEDLRRMILVNTKFEYELKEEQRTAGYVDEEKLPQWMEEHPRPWDVPANSPFGWVNESITGTFYATSQNLPDISMEDFINHFLSAFGAKLYIDYRSRRFHVFLFRNLFKRSTLPAVGLTVSSIEKEAESFEGFTLKYSEDESDEYVYYGPPSLFYKNYLELLSAYKNEGASLTYSTNTFFVQDTGNFYRSKVEEATGENPYLFEVSQFVPYCVSDSEGKTDGEEIEIGFTPVLPFPTTNSWHFAGRENFTPTAFFADVQLTCTQSDLSVLDLGGGYGVGHSGYEHGYFDIVSVHHDGHRSINDRYLYHDNNPINFKGYLNNLLSYEAGYTVGILRTAVKRDGRESSSSNRLSTPTGGYAIVDTDADGFGNSSWTQSTYGYAVTNDFVSSEGEVYESPESVVSGEDLVSLRISSIKRKDPVPESEAPHFSPENPDLSITGSFPRRGLAPQFYADYIHFLVKRKVLTITGRASVSFLNSIRWEYPYLIERYRCFINKISFSVSSRDGIGEVTMEVFTI